MPVVIRKGKTFVSLFALDVNDKFKYPKYFSVLPTGPNTKTSFTEGFFDVAAQQKPKPTTVAMALADAEFSQNACEGARENIKKHGMKIVYDKAIRRRRRPPTSRRSCRRSKPANADIVLICSYPVDSVGIVEAANEIGLNPKMIRRRHGRIAGDWSSKTSSRPSSTASSITRPGCRTRSRCMKVPKRSSRSIRKRPRPPASIRSVITWAAGAMRNSRSSSRRLKRQTASTTTRLPTLCGRATSRP